MDIKTKMHSGALYNPGDEQLVEEQARCLDKQYDYNMTRPSEGKKRQLLLKEMFAEI